ncbi:hypothetical protein GCM10010430_34490 [Kitasatospora cystarginea]|uniref:Uncharacterized protein n=1 Tax=Kitasatospora cystarginea TaxID=58350 RepID=A0ABN3E6Q1_9ACTN
MNGNNWTSERLNQDLQFKVVSEAPRYAATTEKPVEHFTVVRADGEVTGYLWTCDTDGAAGFQRRLLGDHRNSAIFWYGKLLDAKARGISPSQAVQELFAEPGNSLSGRITPESKAVSSLAEVRKLAAEDWVPPAEPVKPPRWRPDPRLGSEQAVLARDAGGWLYKIDEGHDPAGRVSPHAVEGAWQVDSEGVLLRFWHNPVYGSAPETAAPSGEAGAVPPLQAGRRPAGRALLDWLEDPRAPRFCRIAGSSGSGRTHLLTWLTDACPPDNPRTGRRVHVALSAAGLTVRSATWLLADRLNVAARTPADLMAALQDGIPRVLVVTDLDRAGSDLLPDMPERIATELLTPLLQVPWLRLLVESASGTPAATALTAAAPNGAVLDLDDPRWTDRNRFTAWCAEATGAPVAADQVYPSPGLAHLAARTPAEAAIDPSASPADRASALSAAWWTALPDELRPAIRTLAAAGQPMTGEQWAALAGAGGPDIVRRAAGHLPPPTDGQAWRLQPEELTALVVASPPLVVDHTALVREIAAGVPRTGDGRPDLGNTDPQRLGLLLRHAVRSGIADQLLSDPEFLIHADPAAVTAAFEHTEPGYEPVPVTEEEMAANLDAGLIGPGYTEPAQLPQSAFARAWHLAGPVCAASGPADRAGALHAWLTGREQEAADRCAAVSGQRWRAVWSYWQRREQTVRWMTPGHGPCTGSVMVVVDGFLRFIDPQTGNDTEKHDPCRIPPYDSVAVACAQDGSLLLLKPEGVIATLPLSNARDHELDSAVDWAPRAFANGLTAMATLSDDDGPVLALGDSVGYLAWFRTHAGRSVVLSDRPVHRGPVTAVAAARADGDVLMVTGGQDGKVYSWMHGRGPAAEQIDDRSCAVTAVAVAHTPRGLVITAAWADGLVRLRRLGSAATVVDLRLGLAAHSLAIDPSGVVCLALPEAVLGLTLD